MPDDANAARAKPGSRLRELGLVLPNPPSPLGAYVGGVSGWIAALFKRYIAAP
jgi:hypothetical protein